MSSTICGILFSVFMGQPCCKLLNNYKYTWGLLTSGMRHHVNYCLTLIVQATDTSKVTVTVYQTTRCHIPKDSHVFSFCCKNLKSHMKIQTLNGQWKARGDFMRCRFKVFRFANAPWVKKKKSKSIPITGHGRPILVAVLTVHFVPHRKHTPSP
jgi:hypothetical protein